MPPYAWSTQLDSLRSIDLKYLKQWGVLQQTCYWGRYIWSRNEEEVASICYSTNLDSPEGNHIKLNYRTRNGHSEEWKSMDYKVQLVATPCNFGGERWWFICPNIRCNRRCRKLYSYGDYFVCHKCTSYWYDSQKWTPRGFRAWKAVLDADEYYAEHVKREYYNGKPTRKYIRSLRMRNGYTLEDVMAALEI